MPVNIRSHPHGQGCSDLNFLIPELVQRIDYRKGPYFAEEGDFSAAGSVRMRLADSLPAGIASATIGAHGYYRVVLADSLPAAGGILLYGLELNRNDDSWRCRNTCASTARCCVTTGGTAMTASASPPCLPEPLDRNHQVPLRAVESGQLGRFGSLDPSDGGDTAR